MTGYKQKHKLYASRCPCYYGARTSFKFHYMSIKIEIVFPSSFGAASGFAATRRGLKCRPYWPRLVRNLSTRIHFHPASLPPCFLPNFQDDRSSRPKIWVFEDIYVESPGHASRICQVLWESDAKYLNC